MATILLLSTADTELLAARSADAGYRTANPARIAVGDLAALTAGADLAVARLLGGRKAWPEGIEALRRAGLPLIALGGEAAPDAELMALSTVPAGIAAQALAYLREGGRDNLRELAAFLSDTVLLTGEGFAPPSPMPQYGVHVAHLDRAPGGRAPGGQRAGELGAGEQGAGMQGPGGQRAGAQGPDGQDAGAQGAGAQAPGGQRAGEQGAGMQAPGGQSAGAQVPGEQGAGMQGPGGQRAGAQGVGGQDAGAQGPGKQDAGVQGAGGQGAGRPVIAVVYYRAHELSGNTEFVETLCRAIEDRGATPLPVFCGSLRNPPAGLVDLLRQADTVITTVLAAGGASTAPGETAGGAEPAAGPAMGGAGGAGGWSGRRGRVMGGGRARRARRPDHPGSLPDLHAAPSGRHSDAALTPMDAAMQVAIPEFDGRLITVPFSFKEEGPDGIPVYRADPERTARLAGIAVRHVRLRHTPNPAKRIAIMLSSYPTKHARVGNAVGLDTPASAVRLLDALRRAGYDLGPGFPRDGDALIHALIAAGGHDAEWLTEEQMRAAPARVPSATYGRWLGHIPNGLRERIVAHWGDPPGELYVDRAVGGANDAAIVLAALVFGNVVLMIQPPRGFGENPVAIYHDPDLPPSHHYLAAYLWLEEIFRADAIVHLGKHGTLEWLPGKGLGLSGECAPDQVLREVPLVYPFIVNDPGEGTQAKRRAHATIVDHLVPPMARADTYGDLAKLEQLLDEYATVQALDPAKLPAVRAQIWTLVRAAQLHHDLRIAQQPGETEFGDFVLHIDGYLCEVKDAAIRDGLHVLGEAPSGEALINLVGVILRSAQVWGGRSGALPGLRAALGVDEASASRGERDNAEGTVRRLLAGMDESGWDPARAADVCAAVLGPRNPRAGTWCACFSSPRPRWCRGSPRRGARSTRCSMRSAAVTSRPGRQAHRPGAWSTCCPPAATSTRSTRRRYLRAPRGTPAGRSRSRCSPGTWQTREPTRVASASPSGGPRPCAHRATTSPRCSP